MEDKEKIKARIEIQHINLELAQAFDEGMYYYRDKLIEKRNKLMESLIENYEE